MQSLIFCFPSSGLTNFHIFWVQSNKKKNKKKPVEVELNKSYSEKIFLYCLMKN